MSGNETSSNRQEAVVLERSYPASAEALWDLWTTKDGFESWWGPEGFRVEVKIIEPRAGGPLEYDMIADSAEAIAAMNQMGQPLTHNTRGWFDEFRPYARLTLKHLIDFVRGSEPYESLLEVEFQPVGDMTRMTVTVHPHQDPNWTKMAAMGFESQLTKLEGRFG